MNFFGLETISIGLVIPPDDTFKVDTFHTDSIYKKIIHRDGIIHGAIFQGDISYCGVYMQLIKNRIDISNVSGSILDLDFSSFYGVKPNGEYVYL